MTPNKTLEIIVNIIFKAFESVWHHILKVAVGSNKNVLPPIEDEILTLSATALAKKICQRQLKSTDVVMSFISRIKTVNPFINAVVDERFEEALVEAQAADEYVESSGKSPAHLLEEKPFLGVPFTTKNSVAIKGLIQDCALIHAKGRLAEDDCEAVKNMRKAGAIPLLVSNVPELCMWLDSSNNIYGRTCNPYDLTKVPGGSSGGEGALISSAASVFGIGTDVAGSIRIPSYCCGIFGHKTSRNIVSNEGHFPNSSGTGMDNYKVAGPMCRHAEDLLPMLKALAGKQAELLKLDLKVDIKKIQFFYVEDFSDANLISTISNEMQTIRRKVVEYFNGRCESPAKKFTFCVPQKFHNSILYTKMIRAAPFDIFKLVSGKSKEQFNLVLEILKCIFGLSKHTFYVLVYLASRAMGDKWPEAVYQRNDDFLDQLHRQFETTLGDNGVLLMPTQPQPHYYHSETVFKAKAACYTSIFNSLGYPVTQCPLGLNEDGLPTGLQVISTTNNDRLTLNVAVELQKAFGGWQSP